jgi:hypothetical protein
VRGCALISVRYTVAQNALSPIPTDLGVPTTITNHPDNPNNRSNSLVNLTTHSGPDKPNNPIDSNHPNNLNNLNNPNDIDNPNDP